MEILGNPWKSMVLTPLRGGMAPPGAEEIQEMHLGGVEILENAQKMYSEVF